VVFHIKIDSPENIVFIYEVNFFLRYNANKLPFGFEM